MAEVRVAPPEISKPIVRDIKETSDQVRQQAQESEDKKRRGVGFKNLTRDERLAMGKGWQKAHGELDFRGKKIETQKKSAIQEPQEVVSRDDPIMDGYMKIKGRVGSWFHGDEKKAVISSGPPLVSAENIAQTRARDRLIIEPPVLDDETREKKAKAQATIDRLSEEGKKTSKEYRETWERAISPVQSKVEAAAGQNKPMFLERDEMAMIEKFLLAAQRKLASDPEVRNLIKKVDKLPPHSLKPPHIPNIDSRLNQAWIKYDRLGQVLKAFRPRDEVSLMSYNPDQAKSLEETLEEAYLLFPSRSAS